MEEIYEPAEDSYLMSKNLKGEIGKIIKRNPDLKFLEIGIGSGINLQAAVEAGVKRENIFGSDINYRAVKNCNQMRFNCIVSDLFEKIPKKEFDIIAFNPPYLPLDKEEPENSKVATTGGKKGNEVIIRFLNQAKDYIKKKGKIFIVTSSLAEKVNFKGIGYKSRKIDSVNLFFEKLNLWKLSL